MRYGLSSVGSAYIPKLLGIYERELAPIIEGACSRSPQLIVDIGAAEGYYAVGMALRSPTSRIVAFEMEAAGRACLKKMAEANNVQTRIDLRGKCEAPDLEALLKDDASPLVICDVEGYEDRLLDPVLSPSLRRAGILVELHDFIIPGVSDLLQARFESTHTIQLIRQQPRSRDEFPWRTFVTALLPGSYHDWAVSEWRPVPMSWFYMTPRIPT
jgi:predicted O-methyltransferase YrrM